MAYVSTVFAMVHIQQGGIPVLPHYYSIFVGKGVCLLQRPEGKPRTEAPSPALDLILFPFTICLFQSWRIKEVKSRKMIIEEGENLCRVFY